MSTTHLEVDIMTQRTFIVTRRVLMLASATFSLLLVFLLEKPM